MRGTMARRRWACFIAVVALAAFVPLVVPHAFALRLLTEALVWALLTASWDLLSGYTGQISFGHAGFFALGGYVAGGLAWHLHVSPWIGIFVAAIATAAIGSAVGVPALRLRGHYLALVTLGFAEIIRLVATNWLALTGGPFGMHDFGSFPGLPAGGLRRGGVLYLVNLVLVAVSVAVMLFICEQTNAGRAFRAIREDEILAETHGINANHCKLLAFALSSAFAGFAGALYAFDIGLVSPDMANAVTSALILGMAVFGGLGTIWGPAIGAVLLFLASELLRFIGVVYNLIAIGLVIMVFVIFIPRGLAGLGLGDARRTLKGSGRAEKRG